MAAPILITGATGFAGSHLLEHVLVEAKTAAAPPVVAWGKPGGRVIGAGAPGLSWRAVDLLDRVAVQEALAEAAPSAIYHCAGIADVHGSWHTPARPLRINVIGTYHLLEAAHQLGLGCRILVTGSALVYRPSADPLREDDPIAPASPYGVSKLAQEMIAAASGLAVLLARPFNHAGPRQDASYVTSSFARQLAEIEAGQREPVMHVGNLDARRDITDVRDTVGAYRALVERGRTARPYNVCSGRAYRMKDLLEILLKLARVRVAVQSDPERLRPNDIPVVCGSPARITAETGWCARIPIEQTLNDLLDYWRATVSATSRPA